MAQRGGSLVERLPPEASSASRARRAVSALLDQTGLDDVAEVAVLLVSETVTNAVLHAATEIELRCTVEDGVACIGVRDGSTVLPGPRHYGDEATTGRGIGLVELLATSWGVEPTDDGKWVWFTVGEPAGEPDDPDHSPEPASEPLPVAPVRPPVVVRFERLPVPLVRASLQYGDAVLRELALASMEEGGDGSLPAWHGTTIDLAPVLDPLDEAQRAGVTDLDVEVVFPHGAGEGALARRDLVELADRLASEGKLLTPPALAEVAACRHWLLGQISDQALGATPTPWALPEDLDAPEGPIGLTPAERAELRALDGPQVVADEANRIVFVDDAAAELLGWDPAALEGRRLTTIVPASMREAHVAGFAHHQVTRATVIMGRDVRLPALRRDGTTVTVVLHVEAHRGVDGHRGYRGVLRPVPPGS